MTWPTVAVDTTDTDAGTDSPASSRADLLDLIQKVNQIIAHVSTFAATVLDDADAAAVRATLGAPSGSGSASGTNTGDQTITLTGDVTGSGTGSFAATVVAASTTVSGKVELATQGEVDAMADTTRAMTPNHKKLINPGQIAASGAAPVDFSIPAGVMRVTVMLHSVSLDGANDPLIQLGDSGGIETTGYECASVLTAGNTLGTSNYTNAIGLLCSAAASVISGSIVFTRSSIATHSWTAQGALGLSNTNGMILVGGSKTLSAELTTVRVTASAGNFDAGGISVIYER